MRRVLAGVLLGLLAVACSDGDDLTVERIDTDMALGGPIVPIGDRLVGSDPFGADRYAIYASDTGRRWEPVQLRSEEVSGELLHRWPERTGDVVAVGAVQRYDHPTLDGPLPPAFAWVTKDGERWRGGQVTDHLWGGPPAVRESGGLVLAGAVVDQTFQVWHLDGDDWVRGAIEPALRVPDGAQADLAWLWRRDGGWQAVVRESNVLWQLESDDGRTWRRSACEHGCVNVHQSGTLVVSQDEASADAGRTWQPIRTPGESHGWFSELVDDPGGGWLIASRTDWEVGPRASVLRSGDGFVWEQVRTPSCDPDEGRFPDFGGFVELGDRVLVNWSCGDEHSMDRRQLLGVDGGRTKVVVDLPGEGGTFFLHRGRLVAPRLGQDGRLQGFTLVRL